MCLIDSDFDTEDEEFGDDIEELISGNNNHHFQQVGSKNPFRVRVGSSSSIDQEVQKFKGLTSGLGLGLRLGSVEPQITRFCDLDSDKEEPTSPSSSSSDDAIQKV